MFEKFCPCCGRWLRKATIASIGLPFLFHVVHEPCDLARASVLQPYERHEHAHESEPPGDQYIPGLYSVTSAATPTTTTAAPSPTINLPPLAPTFGNMIAWDEAGQTWVELPHCGFGT